MRFVQFGANLNHFMTKPAILAGVRAPVGLVENKPKLQTIRARDGDPPRQGLLTIPLFLRLSSKLLRQREVISNAVYF